MMIPRMIATPSIKPSSFFILIPSSPPLSDAAFLLLPADGDLGAAAAGDASIFSSSAILHLSRRLIRFDLTPLQILRDSCVHCRIQLLECENPRHDCLRNFADPIAQGEARPEGANQLLQYVYTGRDRCKRANEANE